MAWRTHFPRGGSLPESEWQGRNRWIVRLLWAHAVLIPIYGLIRGYPAGHVVAETAIVPVTGVLALWPGFNRRARTVFASVGLLMCSGILVHLSGGVIEMHFHFFVMVIVVALYQDWVPFFAAIGFVFLHHGLVGVLEPASVYNHPAAWNNPWKWAAIHAIFITGASAACLVNWRLHEASLAERDAAQARLREETLVVETLHEVGNTLAAELDTNRLMQTVTDAATNLTDAAFGAFFYNLVDDRGETYQLYTLSGAPIEAFSSFGMPRNTDVFRPTFEGEGVLRLDDVTQDPRYGNSSPHYGMPPGHLPVRSYLAVPVRSRTGEVLGGLFFGHPEVAQFNEVHERLAIGTASQAAIALDNARLYEAERRARATSEAASARFALLADVGRVLASSLETDVIVREFATVVANSLCDTCVVDIVDTDHDLRRVSAISPAPGALLPAPAPALSDDSHPVCIAMQSRQTQIVDDASELVRPGSARESGRPPTAVVVPLIERNDVIGALSLIMSTSAQPVIDVAFAEELARRLTLAIEHVGLYARQRSVAETLQHSLLPESLPFIPGVETAAHYSPGGPSVEIGGDWYDVMQLADGRIAFAIGDVVGRGEKAAALMGQLRDAQRAYVLTNEGPAKVMALLNELVHHTGPDQMATAFFGVLDPETGELRFANAGHPPPLLVPPDGPPTYLAGASGVPIGAVAFAQYEEGRVILESGTAVVLFTDGVVEDRRVPLQTGLDRLRAIAASERGDPNALCAAVASAMLRDREVHDDAAILVLRLVPLTDHLHFRLPSEPNVLAPLRATLRRWLSDAGASDQESYEILLACGEACSNAIRHASTRMHPQFELDARRDGDIEFSVKDEGRWRPARSGVGGRGLLLIESCMDEFDIARTATGTEVRMRRRLQDPAGEHAGVRA